MDSQIINVKEALAKLIDLTAEDVQNEIDTLLPLFISSLECSKKHPAEAVKAACALFERCLPCFQEIDEAEKHIFSVGLPAVRQLLLEVLQEIDVRLDSTGNNPELLDVLGSLLQVCVSLLESLEHCLNFLISQGKIAAVRVRSVIENFGHILVSVLKHCSTSQQIYGSYIEELSEVLGGFFRKTNDLLLKYIGIIKEVILFDCSLADQLDLMCEVLVFLSNAGQLSTCLGVRSMSETWKIFANLTTTYAGDLQGHLDLAGPLSHLAAEVTRTAQSVVQQSAEEKSVERNLKVASFLLRIVIKLCEQFTGSLADCHPTLLGLLLSLHRHSELGLALQGVSGPGQLIDRHLAVGADPLLSQLITDRHFCKELLTSTKQDESSVATVLLLLAVARQLVPLSPEARSQWLSTRNLSRNLFAATFHMIDKCADELGQCTLNVAVAEAPGSKLYKMILTTSIGLAAVLSADEFPALEQALLDGVSAPFQSAWRCLLTSDLWVMVIRISSSSLCLGHLDYLTTFLKPLPQSFQRSVLISLVRRLLAVLPAKQRPSTCGILELEPEKVLSSEECTQAQETLEKFLCAEPPTVYECENMLHTLDLLSHCQCFSVKPLIPSLVKLWDFVDHSPLGRKLASKLLKVFCVVLSQLRNPQLLLVLQELPQLSSLNLKLQGINLLSKLSKIKFTPDEHQENVCKNIADSYSYFLQDVNILIQRASLESFAEFAHLTCHESIVPQTVSGSKELQQLVSNFLQNKPDSSSSNDLVFFRQVVAISFSLECLAHCLQDDVNEDLSQSAKEKPETNEDAQSQKLTDSAPLVLMSTSENKPNSSDSNCLEERIDEMIAQINTNADDLLSFYNQALLSQETLLEIGNIVKKLKVMC